MTTRVDFFLFIPFSLSTDPTLDSGQRIAVLQQKLSELRKTYADVKAELAAVERRRKKIRRREREGWFSFIFRQS